jgi:hypothetical protein
LEDAHSEAGDATDAESAGGDIPARPVEDTTAPEEQVNGELQDNIEEGADANEDDDTEVSVTEEGR